VIDVIEPNFSNYFIRVGGVTAIFVIAILVTREFFPGHESHVVLAISGLGICCRVAGEILEKDKRARKKCCGIQKKCHRNRKKKGNECIVLLKEEGIFPRRRTRKCVRPVISLL
jgi:hypothetical protein